MHGRSAVFFTVVAATLINAAASFYIPVTLADFANNPLKPGAFVSATALITGLYVVSLLASYIVRGRGEALSKNYANFVRLKYFKEFSRLSLSVLRKKHSGYMQSLVNKAAEGLGNIIFSLFWDLVPGLLLAVLFFVYMARESLPLAAANLVVIVVFVVISSLLARKMVPLAAEQNRRNAVLLGGYADFMANITTVTQLGVRAFAQGRLQQHAESSNQQTDLLQQFHARRWFLLHTLFGIAFISTIGFLVGQIAEGHVSPGVLVLFVSAYGMLRGLIERLSENIKAFMEVTAYLQELQAIVGGAYVQKSSHKVADWQSINIKDVQFRHEGSSVNVTVPMFSLQRGQKVCIEGRSGQGKSTFLALLTHNVRPQVGSCMVDNIAFSSVGRDFFETNVTIIAQEAEMFHLSVRDNLTLGRSISDTTLITYLKELELHDWLKGLDKGLDSLVGEKGVTLSAGQKQRLNIIRGVLQDRSLYVLDEPTSHLDAHTEDLVVAFLGKHLANKTAVIVTHRSALKKICDQSFVMHNHTLSKSKK
ncbi:MAG TPA: ABC transporter ATP-binding protein [Candidatus Saccharimonadales bacterium]|nr:ABC transporter ATP-binding protein [Candidatus Saccharimonadales bacterium]